MDKDEKVQVNKTPEKQQEVSCEEKNFWHDAKYGEDKTVSER